MSDLHRTELIKRVAKECGISQSAAERVLNGTVTVIADALANDDAVIWTGLGRFEWTERAERNGINPRTGQRLTIAARRTVICKMGDSFKRRVSGRGEEAA